MTWSVTIDNLREFTEFPDDVLERFREYEMDMYLAMAVAKGLELESCTLSGGRMPTIPPDDEIVDVTIRGYKNSRYFNAATRSQIATGPDVKS